MYEEDPEPLTLNVTLSEIYHQADSCRLTVERAEERSRVFEQFLPLENYTDIIITGGGSSHNLSICALFAWSGALERPVAAIASSEFAHFPEHYLVGMRSPLVTVLLNV